MDNNKKKKSDMETNDIKFNNEIEQMREQLDIMKRKLARQEIINDNLICQAMSRRMSWIKKFVWLEAFLIVPIVIVMYALFMYVFNLPLWLYVVIVAACIVDTYADYRINRTDPSDWIAENLVDTGRKLVKMKRQRMISFAISMAVTIVLFGLFGHEIFSADNSIVIIGARVGFFIGCIIGLTVVYMIYRRMQRTNDTLIRQIDELTDKHGEYDGEILTERK